MTRRWTLVALALLVVGLIAWLFVRPDAPPAVAARPPAPAPAEADPADELPVESPQAAPRADDEPAEWPADAPRQLFGRVTNPDEDPVPGAVVRVVLAAGRKPKPDLVATTGPDGRFTLERVPADPARIEFSARGYQSRTFEQPALPAAPRVQWDAVLDPAAGIHGVVRVAATPVTGAYVSLVRAGTRWPMLGMVRSDGSGRFSLPVEGDGPFTLRAAHAEHGRAELEIDGPGEVVLELPGGGYVEGRVVDDVGDPVVSFALSMGGMLGGSTQSFESAAGTFRYGPLAPGPVVFSVVADGYQPARAPEVEVRSGETTGGVTIVLHGSPELSGRVTDAVTGRPVDGAQVIPAEWRSETLAEASGAVTGPDGRYVLRSLPGTRSSIQVRAEGYRTLLGGGVEGRPGQKLVRDFALTPQSPDQRPSSELTGIGAVLRPAEGGVAISSVVQGGPAEGVLDAGDVVVMVNKMSAAQARLDEVAQAIRGEAGSEVTLWVRRGGQGEPQRVVLRRDRVVMPDAPPRRHPAPHPMPDDSN